MIKDPHKAALIAATALEIGVPADWLDGVIFVESGYNAQAANGGSSAVGLIQFTNTTAKGLGTTTQNILAMTFDQQMLYVKLYLKRAIKTFGKVPDTFLDFYLLIFLPAFAGRQLNAVIPRVYYRPNIGLDTNKDGVITLAEIKAWLTKRLGYYPTKKKIAR